MLTDEHRSKEDAILLELLKQHPERFTAIDETYRLWRIGDKSAYYSAIRLSRIVSQSKMRKELEKSCEINELLCKFYEGISNFQTETVFDHSECQYTAIHIDNRQSLFILRRVDAEHVVCGQNSVSVPNYDRIQMRL